jgi:DNA-binding transcriptional LysR family regulator
MLDVAEIQAIRAIVETGSIKKAADILNTTQPTLSKLLARLEDRLGATFFHRGRRGMTPTAAGSFVATSASGIVTELSKIERQISTMAETGPVSVRLGVGPIVEHLFLSQALSRHLTEFPRTRIDIRTESAEILQQLVLSGEIDLAVGPFDDAEVDPRLQALSVTEEPITYVARPSHPLFEEQKQWSLSGLTQLPLAMPHTPTSISKQIETGPDQADVHREGGIRCENYRTLMSAARDIDLVLSGPLSLFRESIQENSLKAIPTSFTLMWKCACLVRPETLYAAPLKRLVDQFIDVAAR